MVNNQENNFVIKKDSMGEIKVPVDALYGAQTQRAIDNFPISALKMPTNFIKALALVKSACAEANLDLGILDKEKALAINKVTQVLNNNEYLEHFPIDVFQTGSGTSTNMNANEVIANLAKKLFNIDIHPNDHVNMSQSSNDTIPTTIQVSASIAITKKLLPAIEHLEQSIKTKAISLKNIVKTGRTHLMDAMPLTFEQELNTFAKQLTSCKARINSCLSRLNTLSQGGTAIGTGINAHPDFAKKFCKSLSKLTDINFVSNDCLFEGISNQDTAVEVSGQLKVLATTLMKISNDLRWMNSGPLAGLAEISLPALQPGSSIMPGKVNPVIPEAVCMVAAKVMGNDVTITIAGQSGNFQLNVMLPIIAYSLLESIELLSNSMIVLADMAITGFTVNLDNITKALSKNPIMVTALNPVIGYEKGAEIAKAAYKNNMPIKDMALQMTELSEKDLTRLLDPISLTQGGIKE